MPERVWVAAGTLDGDPGIRAGANAFVTSQAEWHELTDGLPRFDSYPPLDVEPAPATAPPVGA